MRITTPPFETLFRDAPTLLTRLVANKMNKAPIPTDDEGLKTLGKHVKDQIGSNDWDSIAKAGTEQLEDLKDSFRDFGEVSCPTRIPSSWLTCLTLLLSQFVGPSHVGKTFKVWTLCKKVFIPVSQPGCERNPIPYRADHPRPCVKTARLLDRPREQEDVQEWRRREGQTHQTFDVRDRGEAL